MIDVRSADAVPVASKLNCHEHMTSSAPPLQCAFHFLKLNATRRLHSFGFNILEYWIFLLCFKRNSYFVSLVIVVLILVDGRNKLNKYIFKSVQQ